MLKPELESGPSVDPKPLNRLRPPVGANDSRIQRVFEISRKEKTGKEEKEKGKGKSSSKGNGLSVPRPPTPSDSDQEDRHEEDVDCAKENEKGKGLKMQVSKKPRSDFAELEFEHLGGPIWEILTGIEARTKFTNSELRHEGTYVSFITCS